MNFAESSTLSSWMRPLAACCLLTSTAPVFAAEEKPAAIPARPSEPGPQHLTGREIEILGLLAAGLANKTIAGRLGISEHTVKSHVAALFGKLGVSTRAEAVAVAVRQGLLML